MVEPLQHNGISKTAAILGGGLKGAALAIAAVAVAGATVGGIGAIAYGATSVGAVLGTAAVSGALASWLGSTVGLIGGVAGAIGGGRRASAENAKFNQVVAGRQQDLSHQMEVTYMKGRNDLIQQIEENQLRVMAQQEEAAKNAGVKEPQHAAGVLTSRGAQPAAQIG